MYTCFARITVQNSVKFSLGLKHFLCNLMYIVAFEIFTADNLTAICEPIV
jgi:hypothetical protein